MDLGERYSMKEEAFLGSMGLLGRNFTACQGLVPKKSHV